MGPSSESEATQFRPVWETEEEADSAWALPRPAPAELPVPLFALLRAQDGLARLEAATEAASPDVAAGLIARVGLFEATGLLGHQRMVAHPWDLALREAGITGSYSAASLIGRIDKALPWSRGVAAGETSALLSQERSLEEPWPDDLGIERALLYARLWRQLAEFVTPPLKAPAGVADDLRRLGAHLPGCVSPDDEPFPWLAHLPPPSENPALRAACAVMAAGIPGEGRGETLGPPAAYLAAALWRQHGFGRGISLPFWSAPLSRIDALATLSGAAFERAWLECVHEAALRARRELARLQAAERKTARLTARSHSHLPAAIAIALRIPVFTASHLAGRLGISTRAALTLIERMRAAGLLREMTGRTAWRAFAIG